VKSPRRLSPSAVRRTYFAKASARVDQQLKKLERLGKRSSSDPLKTPTDVSDEMLAITAALAKPSGAFPAALAAVAGPRKPLLGPLLARFELSRDERIGVLTQFTKAATRESDPVLDLSRQDLTEVPAEIDAVPLELKNRGTARKPIPYREINLGYNPIARLTATDFRRLNGFQGIHLIALKMKRLPPSVRLLTNAVMLNFSWSDLTALPREIFELKKLRALKLNWTEIDHIHEDVRGLRDLSFIELAETPLLETLYSLEEQEHESDGRKSRALTAQERAAARLRIALAEIDCEIRG